MRRAHARRGRRQAGDQRSRQATSRPARRPLQEPPVALPLTQASSLRPPSLSLRRAARAAGTSAWRVTSYKDFDEGEADGVLLSSLGEATTGFGADARRPAGGAGRSRRPPRPTAPSGSAPATRRSVYALRDGKATRKVAKLDGVLVTALAVGPDGTVYAGTLPGGRVFAHRRRDGAAKRAGQARGRRARVGARRSTRDGKHALRGAPGPTGKLFAIDVATSGKAPRARGTPGEKHLLVARCATATTARSLVGSVRRGDPLPRRARRHAPRALHDFDGDEVRAIVAPRRRAVRRGQRVRASSARPRAVAGAAAAKGTGHAIVLPPAPARPRRRPPPGRDRKGKGAVYRVDPDGRVEQLHALADGYFTAPARRRRRQRLRAAGANGRVYLHPPRPHRAHRLRPARAAGAHAARLGGRDAVPRHRRRRRASTRVDRRAQGRAATSPRCSTPAFPARWGNAALARHGRARRRDALAATPPSPTRPGAAGRRRRRPTRAPTAAPAGVASPDGALPAVRASRFGARRPRCATSTRLLPAAEPARRASPRSPSVTTPAPNDRPGRARRRAASRARRWSSCAGRSRTPTRTSSSTASTTARRARPTGSRSAGPSRSRQAEFDWNTEAVPDGNYRAQGGRLRRARQPARGARSTHELVSTPFLVDNRKPEVAELKVDYPFVSGARARQLQPDHRARLLGRRRRVAAARARGRRVRRPAGALHASSCPTTCRPGPHAVTVRAVDAADNVGLGAGRASASAAARGLTAVPEVLQDGGAACSRTSPRSWSTRRRARGGGGRPGLRGRPAAPDGGGARAPRRRPSW